MDTDAQSLPPAKIVEAVQRATRDFKLCPNRVWAVAGSLPERERNLPMLIPATEKIKQTMGHEGHNQCTFDFCEYSRLDFTSVAQRHESSSCINNPCKRLQFPTAILEEAANAGNPTAWKLDGKSMIEPPQQFMAISHVWSDGTGTGAWLPGEVNECLYTFFEKIAKQFQCEGIWWDTICIPEEKGARSKAINKIQSNYEDARITLVHDCFLRNWEWIDAETACFAIIMSPWFSRGWTSLELARSHKVKVIFKGPRGPLIKDLDEDILAKADDPSTSHKIATEAIAKLRNRLGIREVNELLTILGPRHTSWPRDIAIISGLLVGVKIAFGASQQGIYQNILKKIARVSHGHLFHNSATMSNGFSWCPTSLLDMPLASSRTTLHVEENGVVVGGWKVYNLNSIPEENYIWKDTHPLIEAALRLALAHKDKHVLLVEPKARSIARALLVKTMRNEETLAKVHCQFVGSVYFHPPQDVGEEDKRWIEVEVRIGHTEGMAEIEKKAWDYVSELKKADNVEIGERERQMEQRKTHSNAQESSALMMTLLSAAEKGVKKKVQLSPESEDDRNSQDSDLLSAAAKGDEVEVELLLRKGANPDFQDKHTWTALHIATWRGYDRVVQKLIGRADQNLQDRLGQRALHLAAERGNREIIGLLLEGADLNVQCNNGQTVLHRAAWSGSKAVVSTLLEKLNPNIDPNVQDKDKKTALHIAAEKGYASVVKLLLKKAEPNIQDSQEQTALHLAAKLESEDQGGRTPLSRAAENGHEAVVKLLLGEGAKLESRDQGGRTPLLLAARNGHEAMVKLLLEKGAKLEPEDQKGRTPLSKAAENGHEAVVRLLLEKGAKLESKWVYSRTPLLSAAMNGHEAVVKLLLEKGAKKSWFR